MEKLIGFNEVTVGDIIELNNGPTPMRFVNVQKINSEKEVVIIEDAVGEVYKFDNNLKCIKRGECQLTKQGE